MVWFHSTKKFLKHRTWIQNSRLWTHWQQATSLKWFSAKLRLRKNLSLEANEWGSVSWGSASPKILTCWSSGATAAQSRQTWCREPMSASFKIHSRKKVWFKATQFFFHLGAIRVKVYFMTLELIKVRDCWRFFYNLWVFAFLEVAFEAGEENRLTFVGGSEKYQHSHEL